MTSRTAGRVQVTILALCGLVLPAPAQSPSLVPAITFASPRGYFAAGGTGSLAIIDLNRDGNADIAVSQNDLYGGPGSIKIFLGSGNGAFTPGPTVPAQIPALGRIRAADIDRDGNTDLVVHQETGGHFLVFFGNGQGGITRGSLVTAGLFHDLLRFELTDLNGDKIPDIVAATNDGVAVMTGNGDGTLLSPSSTPLGKCDDVHPAQVNSDGKPDLVAVCGMSIVTLIGDGAGHFASPIIASLPSGVAVLALSDFNHDGLLDAAVAFSSQSGFAILPGTGAGAWGAPVLFDTPEPIQSFQVDDLNGDRRPDLLATVAYSFSQTTRGLWVYLGTQTGFFQPPTSYATVAGPLEIAVARLRPAAPPDVVAASAGFVSVLWNRGGGALVEPLEVSVHAPVTGSQFSDYLDRADLNGDGLDDILAAGGSQATVLLATGDPAAPFRAAQQIPCSGDPNLALLADFNADGIPDAAIGVYGRLTIYLAGSDGVFRERSTIDSGLIRWPIVVGDFDGDGKVDLAGPGIDLYFGNGDGTFQPASNVNTAEVQTMVAADLNGNGRTDLVYVANPQIAGSFEFRVRFGKADRTMSDATRYPTPSFGECLLVGDLNGDKIQDIVSIQAGRYQAFLGDGTGGLHGLPSVQTAFQDHLDASLADLNGDGRLDLSVLDRNTSLAHIFAGDGVGHFAPARMFVAAADPFSIASGRFSNGATPGKSDLAVSNREGVLVLLRNATP
jgi:hypothetical protein